MEKQKLTITVREAANALGVAVQTVRALVENGDLPSVRISPRRIVIPAALFEQWLVARATRERR